MAIRRILMTISASVRAGLAGLALLGMAATAGAHNGEASRILPAAEQSAAGQSAAEASADALSADFGPTYADLVDLASQADLVGMVLVQDQIPLPAERAPGVAPGHMRLYIKSLTQSVLAAPRAIGQELVFLVDVPVDERGRPPRLKKQTFLVFGDLDPARPRDLQLLSSDAMMPADPVIEQRVRQVLIQLSAPDKPSAVTGIADVISIPGNLAGESETQIFVETEAGVPVSMNVIRRPGMVARWGISFGDIVNPSARPPARETLAWYQFACNLPRELPPGAFLQRDRAAQAQARTDYSFILNDLGDCDRRL